MTPNQAVSLLRNLLNAGPVKLLLNTPDICAAEQAIQAIEKALAETSKASAERP